MSVFMEIVLCLHFQKGVPMAARRTLGGEKTSLTGGKIRTEWISMYILKYTSNLMFACNKRKLLTDFCIKI